ncbi:hypothetical protein N665_0544s0003 [Sinapis alba]|nr:hypothetical protein N665_0544s0003 [Sinapis alba]
MKLFFVVYNRERNIHCTSSSVTRACDPCGDNRVMGRWIGLIGPGSGWALFWPAHSKFGVEACEWGRLREAGFTEQRSLPALDGGRITGHCLPSPL